MGVHGLWPLLHPVARPVALETMGGKKLAIDSSIWLYQFQIAMRDKDGRALDNAHILGFLRRICKLLFYGIKPVFVFDGGAPTIKKVAISNRKNRKQGAKETAARTAEKLLAAQLRAAAIKQARKDAIERKEKETGDLIDENTAYMDEEYGIAPRGAPQRRPKSGAGGTNNDDNSSSSPARDNHQQQQQQDDQLEPLISPVKKKYVHKDAYALPIIEGPISSRGLPSDPRLATEEELRNFIDEMKPDEAEDFDMNSDFFKNLPVETKYEIIGDLRIKSRQSNFKRVEAMKNAPTPLDFSRAQIMHLSHRNVLTQKLLTMTDSLSRVMPISGGPATRIAGERNKEYVLIKNDNTAEGGTGYILGVRGGGETASTPVKIDGTTTEESDTDKATTTDEEFEKVEIPSQHHQIYKRSTSPDTLREKRKELAEEAIRLKYSPVKPLTRRGDSPVDDLPPLPPQRPLFSSTSANKSSSNNKKKSAGTTPSSSSFASTASKINARSSSFIPPKTTNQSTNSTYVPDNGNYDDVWNQITNAVAHANDVDVRLSRDEQDDLARAIEASKQDLNGNIETGITINSTTDESGDESDVSFDEVETTTNAQQKPARAASQQQQQQQQYNWIMPEPHEIMHVQKQKQKQQQQQQQQQEQEIVARQAEGVPGNADDSDDSVEYVNVDISSAGPLEEMPKTGIPQSKGAVSSTPAASSPPTGAQTSQSKASGLKNKKPPGLHLDIPAEASVPSSSLDEENSQRGRTPRPDLTEEQARRDTSPQRVEEKNGIVQRDYAQQPRSESEQDDVLGIEKNTAKEVEPMTGSPVTLSPALTKEAVTKPQPTAPARDSLMSRTLSNQSKTGRNQNSSSALASTVQEAAPLLSTVSQADEEALTRGTMSVLDEIRAAMPNEEEGVDKGDLQAIVESGESGPLASKLNGHRAGQVHDVEMDLADEKDDLRQEAGAKSGAAAARDSSPEIEYEWSPSPEPAARNRPVDPTLLPPDDPNYIPPDIDFPEPGHELSDLDDEDQEHLHSLNSEKAEYAKFLAELKSRNLDEMEFEVENELTGLQEQNKRDKKMADDITQQMAKDIQLLLKVMGLPYVVAPMEAEAQCAELLSRSLVDGVITDDNDVFLFGATKVYKNMFNQNKYVECYLATDIERELALDRHRLIRLAYFLGSDYCDGLPGVGPVLGMELMAEFPSSNGLADFRNWWLKVQRGRDTPADSPTAFRRKFKKSKRDLYIDESWPNPEVAKAYLHPSVDESDQPFMWGIPDLDALREFLNSHLGWGHAKTDDLILPIIRKMTGRAAGGAVNQSVISNFFDVSGGTGRFAPMSNKGYQSKRLQAVVKAWRQSQQQLAKEEGSEDDADAMLESEDDAEESQQSRGKGKAKRPAPNRRGSSIKGPGSRPSSSRRSSTQQGSSSRRGSSKGDVSENSEDAAFNEELEAKLASMGVKRKRETPIGSARVVKPAKRSKKGGGKLAAKARSKPSAASTSATKDDATKQPLFAEESGSDNEEKSQEEEEHATTSQRKQKPKATKRAVMADSDEYEG